MSDHDDQLPGTPDDATTPPEPANRSGEPASRAAEPATAATASPARRSGRPVLGAIAGFFLGLFVWLDLVLFGTIAFESVTFWIFPIVGLAIGIALARWAPLGRSSA